jgi:hypothetical protein
MIPHHPISQEKYLFWKRERWNNQTTTEGKIYLQFFKFDGVYDSVNM